jgi:hypothetical protein
MIVQTMRNVFKRKSETALTIVNYVIDIEKRFKRVVKYIRCDDAGENRALEKACIKAGLGIQFEYTSPGTPQRNGRVERKFATLYGRVRAMYDFANVEESIRVGTWTECANTAFDIDNLIVSNNKPVSSYPSFYEEDPKYIKQMRTFGEMEDESETSRSRETSNVSRPCSQSLSRCLPHVESEDKKSDQDSRHTLAQ